MGRSFIFLIVMLCLVGCGGEVVTPTPTAVVPPTAISAAVLPTVTETAVPPTLTITPIPSNTPTPSLTPTSVVNFAATDTPTPTHTPVPTITPTSTPVGGLQVGNVANGRVAANGLGYHLFSAQEKVTVYLMLHAADSLDAGLAIYDFDAVIEAEEQGLTAEEVLLASEPLVLLNQAAVGEPELYIFRPEFSGTYTIVAGSVGNTAGPYRLYMFDPQVTTVDTVSARVVGLTENDERTFLVTSNGDLPIGVFVYPFASGDMVIEAQDVNGDVIKTADLGSYGVSETMFLQPPGDRSFTIVVRENEGLPLTIGYAIVALQDRLPEE